MAVFSGCWAAARATSSPSCMVGMLLFVARRATSHIDDLAADKARLFRGQEADHIGNIAWLADAPHRDALARFFDHLLWRYAQAARRRPRHLRIDESWRDGIGRNPKWPKLHRQRAREALQPCLGRRVVGLAAIPQGRGGRQTDDAPVALLDHILL